MTCSEIHIGIISGLGQLNFNLFKQLLPEQIDYYANRVGRLMVKEAVETERENTANIETYGNILNYNSLLNPFLKIITLDKNTNTEGYDYADLPLFDVNITSGKLYAGKQYKVSVVGTTTLSSFGLAIVTLGTTFTCTISTANATALQVGCKYRILTKGTSDYTTVGAINNMVGTEFIATGTSATGTGTVTPLSAIPTWAGGTKLLLLEDDSVFEPIASGSVVDYGSNFSTGSLIKGVTYRVVTGGTISDLTQFGSGYATVESGYMFYCTQSGTPTWATSGVVLTQTKLVQNRLVKVQDTINFLNHSFGTVVNSPISTFVGGKIFVYHNNLFTINAIKLVYAAAPRSIDKANDITTNMSLNFQDTWIDNVVKYIANTKVSQ